MTEYELDNDVCPSSLDEDGKPTTEGETAHKWSIITNFEGVKVLECDECGAVDEEEGSVIIAANLEAYKASEQSMAETINLIRAAMDEEITYA